MYNLNIYGSVHQPLTHNLEWGASDKFVAQVQSFILAKRYIRYLLFNIISFQVHTLSSVVLELLDFCTVGGRALVLKIQAESINFISYISYISYISGKKLIYHLTLKGEGIKFHSRPFKI